MYNSESAGWILKYVILFSELLISIAYIEALQLLFLQSNVTALSKDIRKAGESMSPFVGSSVNWSLFAQETFL